MCEGIQMLQYIFVIGLVLFGMPTRASEGGKKILGKRKLTAVEPRVVRAKKRKTFEEESKKSKKAAQKLPKILFAMSSGVITECDKLDKNIEQVMQQGKVDEIHAACEKHQKEIEKLQAISNIFFSLANSLSTTNQPLLNKNQ